jgi:chromosome segregation ATPase
MNGRISLSDHLLRTRLKFDQLFTNFEKSLAHDLSAPGLPNAEVSNGRSSTQEPSLAARDAGYDRLLREKESEIRALQEAAEKLKADVQAAHKEEQVLWAELQKTRKNLSQAAAAGELEKLRAENQLLSAALRDAEQKAPSTASADNDLKTENANLAQKLEEAEQNVKKIQNTTNLEIVKLQNEIIKLKKSLKTAQEQAHSPEIKAKALRYLKTCRMAVRKRRAETRTLEAQSARLNLELDAALEHAAELRDEFHQF